MIFPYLICALLAALLFYVLRQKAVAEKEWASERGALLTRIQAPKDAPFILAETGEPDQQYVPFDDDEAFEKAQEVFAEVGYTEEQRLTNGN